MATERWKPVVGWGGDYEVSDLGRVRSMARQRLKRSRWGAVDVASYKPRLLKGHCRPCGYIEIHLRASGRNDIVKAHRLVLEAFVGPCPPGLVTCHGNDDGSDNRLCNLRWGTSLSNSADAISNGRIRCGVLQPQSKLVDWQVRVIRRLRRRLTQRQIGGIFGVHQATVSDIHRGVGWRHL